VPDESNETPDREDAPTLPGSGGDGFAVGERPRGFGRAVHVAVLVGLLAVAGGAVFAVRSLTGTDAGGATPESAARQFFDAVANEDALGMLESLLPSERDVLKGPLVDITKELGRLRVLSTDLDLSKISGLDLSLENLRFSSSSVTEGLSVVRIEAGTARSRVTPKDLPLGPFVRDLIGPDIDRAPAPDTEDLADDDTTVATVRDGDRWYVSLWYSLGEAARKDAGAPPPALGRGIAPNGAASPEDAVDGFIRALAGLDVRRLIELLPPDEARALRDYAPLFLEGAESAAAEARKQFRATIGTLVLSSRPGDDDRALVKIDQIRFSAEAADGSAGVSYDGKCVHFSGELFVPLLPAGVLCQGDRPPFAVPELPTRGADLHIVAVRRGGSWYVSPTRTFLDGLVATLRALEPKDLESIRDFFTGFSEEQGSYKVSPLSSPAA
jgi:hypothetical protein